MITPLSLNDVTLMCVRACELLSTGAPQRVEEVIPPPLVKTRRECLRSPIVAAAVRSIDGLLPLDPYLGRKFTTLRPAPSIRWLQTVVHRLPTSLPPSPPPPPSLSPLTTQGRNGQGTDTRVVIGGMKYLSAFTVVH